MKSLLLLTLLAAGKLCHQGSTEEICYPNDTSAASFYALQFADRPYTVTLPYVVVPQDTTPPTEVTQPTWPFISTHLPEDSLVRQVCQETGKFYEAVFVGFEAISRSGACNNIENILEARAREKQIHARTRRDQLELFLHVKNRLNSGGYYPYEDEKIISVMNTFQELSADQKWSEHKKIKAAADAISVQRANENPYAKN